MQKEGFAGRRRFCRAVFLGGAALALPGAAPARAASSLAKQFSAHTPGSEITVDHGAFARFLETYLQNGPDGVNRVAYGSVTAADRRALKRYIAGLEGTSVAALSRNEQFAFWANLYNAVTLDVVLNAWPVESILDIKPTWLSFGPWKKERVSVAGRALSLDNIEHDILRAIWRDPRIHYAVNCASVGCPNLHRQPLKRANLNDRLNAWAREYVNHPRGAAVDKEGRLTVSKIYKWYEEDFGGSEQGVIGHLKAHAGEALRGRLAGIRDIAGYEYDWSINAPPNGTGGTRGED
ncbi:MAG: DUF547 domain-containing protein [Alphaproteobacteria bacterium]